MLKTWSENDRYSAVPSMLETWLLENDRYVSGLPSMLETLSAVKW